MDCNDCVERLYAFLDRLRDCCTSEIAPTQLRERVILKLRGSSPPTT